MRGGSKMRDALLIVLLVVLVVGGVVGDPVELEGWEYSTSTQFFGNLPFGLMYTELDYAEELEYSEDLFCSTQNYKKFPSYQPATCLPCNYSGPSEDGICVGTDLNVMLPNLEGRGLPNCECDRSYCEGEILYADSGAKRYTIRERDIKLSFRYEHTDVESGFVVRLTPVDEGPLFMTVSNANDLEPDHIIGEIYTVEPILDYVKVCPSFNKFGEGSPSITYFIFVLVGDFQGKELATFDLSIESIPNLLPEEEGEYEELTFWPGAAFAEIPNNDFSNSPIYLNGTSLAESNGGTEPRYYVIAIMIPLTECVTYSFSVEMLNLNPGTFNYFSLLSVWTEVTTLSTLQTLAEPRARPFKVLEALEPVYNSSTQVSISSSGKVFSVCPTGAGTPENPEFIAVRISSSPFFYDYSLLLFLRRVTRDTRTRINYPFSEFSPLQFQRKFLNAPILRCPCNEDCDDCASRDALALRFFNRLSGLSPETFPTLLSKVVPGCDLAAELGISLRNKLHYRCQSPWRDSICGVMRTIPVFESTNPRIYPIPEVARLENAFSFPAAPDFLGNITSEKKIRGDKIGLLFTLSGGDVSYFYQERLLNQCEVGFIPMSSIHSATTDMPLESTYRPLSTLKAADTPCSQSNFDSVSTLLNQAEKELRDLTRSGVLVGENVNVEERKGGDVSADELVERSSGATYASYSLLFSQEWQSCQNLGNSFLIFEPVNRTLTNSAVCGTNDDPDDPCCNDQLAWETCCSAEGRDTVLENVQEPLFSNTAQIEEECIDSECIETFVDDYRVSYQEVVLNGVCENEFVLETGLNRVVSECREKWIGSDEFGMLCYTDDDCTSVYGTGECDIVANRCKEVRKEMESGFLDCLISNVDSVTRSAIANELAKVGLFTIKNVGEGVTAELLREYLQEYECVSDYGPMSEYRERYVARSLNEPEEQFCAVCYDLYCLTSFGCDWPLQCLDKRKACAPQLAPFRPSQCHEPADEALVCNWNNSLSSEECNLDTYTCLYCHNSSNCVVLPATSEEECENTPICLLPGGEILWDVSENECNDRKYCTEKCRGEECSDEESCEEISGFCEDADAILETIEFAVKQHPNLENATKGVCVYPIRAKNTPACPYLTETVVAGAFTLDSRTGNSWDFTAHRGCVAFTSCIPTSIQFGAGNGAAVLPSGCSLNPSTPAQCETEFGGSWLDLPIQNKEDCQNPLRYDDEDFPGFCLEDRTGNSPYLSRKTRQGCEGCGGIPRTPANWREGRWVGGLSRVGEWRKPEMTSTYHYVNDSISFLALNDLLSLSSANVNSFLSEVGVVCGISPFVDYLSLFSCDCGRDVGEDCQAPFQSDNGGDNIIGGAWLCPGVNSKVGISVGRLEVNGTDVGGDLCKYTQISVANYEVFVGNRERVPLSVLGDPNPIDAEAVRNTKGASVGDVVGDGIQFVYEETGFVDFKTEIKRVKISLFLDVGVLKRMDSDYVFDFGIEVLDKSEKRYENEVELRPLGAQLTGSITNGVTVGTLLGDVDEQFTVALTGFWDNPFSGDSPRLYPIVRETDYEDEDRDDVLSQGEKVMVAVFGALYGLSIVVGLVLTSMIFSRVPSLTNLILCFLVELTFIFRCIYLSMFAAGYFREEDAGSFVLVESPSFILLSIASVILMSFGFCLYCLKNHVQQDQVFTKFWTVWLIFNLFLYLILALVLILETQLDTSDTLIISCYGRVVEVEESFTIQAIRIAYHSFLLLIAIVTCVTLLSLGQKLTKTASSASSSSSSLSSSLRVLSIIAALSVLLTSVLWVVYSSVSGSSPYFVIPLFICEAVPLLALLWKTIPHED